jgi:hypothetical protein
LPAGGVKSLPAHLDELRGGFESGELRPKEFRTSPLIEAAEVYRMMTEAQRDRTSAGKFVLSM